MRNWTAYLEEAEVHLRGGRVELVRAMIKRVRPRKVPRAYVQRFANILRRCDFVNRGLALLKPIVYPDKPNHAKASATEIAEYAILLTRAGLITEAQGLLSQLDSAVVPEVSLHHAFALFASWDYAAALPHLRTYIANAPSDYQRTVGLVNLAAAQIATGAIIDAKRTLKDCLARTSAEGQERLRANSLELLAQIYVDEGLPAQALAALDKAASLMLAEKFSEAFYVRKWRAIALALRDRDVAPLKTFAKLAVENGDWENLRDVQFYMLKFDFSEALFLRLVFGTANPYYQIKLRKAFPLVPIPKTYNFGGESPNPLDLQSSALTGKTLVILFTLLRDFYRPTKLATLFSELYPGEYYDVLSSPDRVHQALRRCRLRLRELNLPIEVVEERNGYRIETKIPIRLELTRTSLDPLELNLARLRSVRGPLTARQIQNALGMTVAQYRWFIGKALSRRLINAEGERAGTTYRVA